VHLIGSELYCPYINIKCYFVPRFANIILPCFIWWPAESNFISFATAGSYFGLTRSRSSEFVIQTEM
jgi:hypothetical protein